jgi:hypothetical protein
MWAAASGCWRATCAASSRTSRASTATPRASTWLGETRRLARGVLPGVRYRRRLLWRYSLVWTKPA